MRINFKKEYVIITGLLLLIVFFSDFLRIILGLPFTLFLSGYLLMAILFPEKDVFDCLDRIAVSMGLSIIIVPLIGWLLNDLSSSGIRLIPMMLSLIFLDVFLFFLSWFRRSNLPEEKRYALMLKIELTEWTNKSKVTKVIHSALLFTVFLLIVTLVFILSSPKPNQSFTEFYITSLDDVTAGYPEQLQAGENGAVKAIIINNEQQDMRYRMEIRVDGDIIQTISHIYLKNREKHEITVLFKSEEQKDSVIIEFLLFREGQDMTPYRKLRLWVDILPALDQGLE